jgi:hypothetical protein
MDNSFRKHNRCRLSSTLSKIDWSCLTLRTAHFYMGRALSCADRHAPRATLGNLGGGSLGGSPSPPLPFRALSATGCAHRGVHAPLGAPGNGRLHSGSLANRAARGVRAHPPAADGRAGLGRQMCAAGDGRAWQGRRMRPSGPMYALGRADYIGPASRQPCCPEPRAGPTTSELNLASPASPRRFQCWWALHCMCDTPRTAAPVGRRAPTRLAASLALGPSPNHPNAATGSPHPYPAAPSTWPSTDQTDTQTQNPRYQNIISGPFQLHIKHIVHIVHIN